MEISYAESVSLPLEEETLIEHLEQFLQILGYPDRSLSLYFTDDDEIQELNQRFREKDKPTDVLSWSYWEEDPDSEILGELAISMNRIREQAKSNNWSETTELIRLLAHGCAHLVGYDHERSVEEERKMLAVEIKMLHQVGLDNIYP